MPSQPSEGLHWDMEAIAAVMPQRQQQHNNNNEPTTLSLHRNPSLAFRHPTMRPHRSLTPPPQNDDVSMQVDATESGNVTERDTSAEVRRDVTRNSDFQLLLSRAACHPRSLFAQSVLRVRKLLGQPFQQQLRTLLESNELTKIAPPKRVQLWLLMSDVTGVQDFF